MKVEFREIQIAKKRPLRISRGVSVGATSVFVFLSDDGLTGIGEMCGISYDGQTSEKCIEEIRALIPFLETVSPASVLEVENNCKNAGVGSATAAAINIACWDWLGKRSGLPLWKHLGLSNVIPETSVTIGLNDLDVIAEQTEQILRETGAKCLKQKLGGEGGIDADKEKYLAAQRNALGIRHRVDANGGWSVSDAVIMTKWLSENGCEYVEQPISHLEPEGLPEIFAKRKIPIFLDEFIKDSRDVVRFAPYCDGINLKLMKSGGISEGIRVVHTARAHDLKTMIGCFGESSVAISAGAHIGSMFDYIDLDSHLNLNPDPAMGLGFDAGMLLLSDAPGLGVDIRE